MPSGLFRRRPSIRPGATTHSRTVIARQTDGQPVEGWRVRYEIVDGPPAGFAPDGAQVLEVVTNEFGQATASIYQSAPGPGTNRVGVQVIRPADPGGQRLVLGTGSTTKTWTAGELTLRTSGPDQVSVGATASYRIEVANDGATTIRDATISTPIPPGMTFIGANPQGAMNNGQLSWRLGNVSSGTRSTIEVNYRADQPGTVNYCASLSSPDGVSAQDCASTTVTSPALDVQISGPDQAVLGQDVRFTVTVTNRGNMTARGIVVVDRFDAGLEHSASRSPIERDVRDLGPGEAEQFAVTFRASQIGRLCNDVEVQSSTAISTRAQACVNVTAGSGVPPATPPPISPSPGRPPSTPPDQTTQISVRKTGPTRAQVGETAEFQILIENNGNVPLTNLRIVDSYDESLVPVAATDGYREAGDDLIWLVDQLPAGRSILFEVNCECAAEVNEACNRATVHRYRRGPTGARRRRSVSAGRGATADDPATGGHDYGSGGSGSRRCRDDVRHPRHQPRSGQRRECVGLRTDAAATRGYHPANTGARRIPNQPAGRRIRPAGRIAGGRVGRFRGPRPGA